MCNGGAFIIHRAIIILFVSPSICLSSGNDLTLRHKRMYFWSLSIRN